jgi:S1-C subfamily serine protease
MSARWYGYIVAAALLALALIWATLARAQSDEIRRVHAQMLAPAVQVDAAGGTGSGTVVSSIDRAGKLRTYVLTNHHVIAGAIGFTEEYDAEKRQNVKRERRDAVTVRFHRYADGVRHTGSDNRLAYILAYDALADIALLVLDDESTAFPAARAASVSSRLDRGERVFAVGAGLGNAPFMTEGILGGSGHRIDGHPYIMATAPIIFGNSGGALYRRAESGDYELIGIPSRVAVRGSLFSSSAVTHIGWHIQLSTVREFLARNNRAYVLD